MSSTTTGATVTDDEQDFESRYKACGALFNGLRRLRLTAAVKATRRLVQDFQDEPRAWFLHNLAVCLSNGRGGPLDESVQEIPTRAKIHLGDVLPPEVMGDMQRDQAICLITYARGSYDLERAEELLNTALQVHVGDPSRLACLVAVRGRLAFARKQYIMAWHLQNEANETWQGLGPRPEDRAWIALNHTYRLRTAVATWGRRSLSARLVVEDIMQHYPEQAVKARILTAPGGLWLFNFLLTHR